MADTAAMRRAIRVLHLEDNPRDAEIIRKNLCFDRLSCEVIVAAGRERFEQELKRQAFDLILLDYNVPHYDGITALRQARQAQPGVPLIVITGALEEQEAVECIKSGATDYLLKHRLQRLVPAVERALQEAEERQQRLKAQQALRESEYRLELAVQASALAVWDWNIVTGEVSLSAQWWAIIGYDEGEVPLHVEAWARLTNEADLARLKADLAALFKGTIGTLDVEYRMRTKNNEWRWIRTVGRVVERDAAGQAIRATGTHGDVTIRKEQEERIARLSRIHALLSGFNSLFLRVRERQPVLEEACRIAVRAGGFRMAWIGLIDEATLAVKVAAVSGHDDGYLAMTRSSVDPNAPEGHGIMGRAMRERRPVVLQDSRQHPDATVRDAALSRGYRSSISLPLVVRDKVIGAMALYAAEAGVFDTEEIRLLSDLAADVSFALDYVEKEKEIQHLAYFDALTSLPNARLFLDRCEQALRAAAMQELAVAVLVLNLERFGRINETLGRSAGDLVLRTVADRLTAALQASTVARLGSDNFAVLVPGMQVGSDALRVLEDHIMPAIAAPLDVNGDQLRLAATVGIAVGPTDGRDPQTLVLRAETALDRAREGNESYRYYEPDMNTRVAERLTIETKLRVALEREQFVLHYQPKFDIRTRRLMGVEALIRWMDPEKGLIPPGAFIPVLEETGMILEVGDWAMRQALSEHGRWRAAGLAAPRIAVNVSPLQLCCKDFAEKVADVLARCGADDGDHGLDLEITESVVMADIAHNIAVLQKVRELGVAVYIDDFGTGYSSLSYITRLPITALKIDRAFVLSMTENPNDMTVVSTIISLAHALQLRVVAEGVETAEQDNFLRLLQCDEAQGYCYGRPVPAEQITPLLEHGA